MPPGIKAELIDGKVFMPSPAKPHHGSGANRANAWLGVYEAATPAVSALDNVTVILSEASEPQPDACLILAPEHGGRTWVAGDGWLHGAPELVVEVAATTAAYDLYEKKLAYEAAGVQEYIAVLVLDQVVRWFVLRDGRYGDLEPGADGILRSEVFPGLWLDPNAMLQSDIAGVLSSLRDGLASPEHAEFVARVQAPSG